MVALLVPQPEVVRAARADATSRCTLWQPVTARGKKCNFSATRIHSIVEEWPPRT